MAVEEPLEIRVHGETLATTLRTPGDDEELALGFLLSEGLIRGASDVGTLSVCGRPGEPGYGNVIDVAPASGHTIDVDTLSRARRGTLTTAACGICGKADIDAFVARTPLVAPGPSLTHAALQRALEALPSHQSLFAATGGVHAAGIADEAGRLLAVREDIGRHNAVDKVVGSLLRLGALPARRAPGAPCVLVVSGRLGFEMAQKAAAAGLAAVVSVSAASSLAIDLSQRVGLTLAAFARDGRISVYAHDARLRGGF